MAPFQPPRSAAACAALTVGIAVLATLLQWSIYPLVSTRIPFLFFLPALAITSTLLGRGPGLFILLAGLTNGTILLPPTGSPDVAGAADRIVLLVYAAVGLAVLYTCGRVSDSNRRAAEAEQRLNLAQEDAGVGLFEIDLVERSIHASPTLWKLLGRNLPATQHGEWSSLPLAGDVEQAYQELRNHARHGATTYEREHAVTLPDGTKRWLLSKAHFELGQLGKATHIRGASIDVTERRRIDALLDNTRAELMQQVADLQGLHELSTRLLDVADLRQQLQAILEATAEFHGTDRGLVSLLRGGTALEVEASIGFGAEALDKLVHIPIGTGACGSACALKHRVAIRDTEADELFRPYRALSRMEGFRAVHSTPIINLSGEVMGALSVHWSKPREPTEREIRLAEICANKAAMFIDRHRAQLVARESDRRFRVALESSAVPFIVLSPVREDGRITDFRWLYANKAAAAVYLHPQEAVIGSKVRDIRPGAWGVPGLFENYTAVAERGETREFEVFYDADGIRSWFHVVASPLDGSVASWFADVTQRKEQEQELKEADRRKDEFLATLAHELRNPLAPVRQATDVLRLPGSSDVQRRHSLDVIERQVGNMALLLDDLLEVSRITRGMLTLRKRSVELHAVIDAALEAARPLIDEHRHSAMLELPPHEVWFEADNLRLAQIIANLLTNAANYTDEGGTIRIAAERQHGDIVIRVRDSGIGIEQEALHEIFQMFTRVKAASARPASGLGIGLALAKGLAELHGGSIEAHSEGAGKGSEFTVRLPAGETSERPTEAAPAAPATEANAAPARRILIADDNRDAAESLGMLLELLGHEVAVTFDGEEALAKFAQFQPEVALLDLGMPGLSGTELARAIRHRPDGGKAILIAVTGWGQERDKQIAYDAGFDHHLTKPIDPKQLARMLADERERMAM